MKNSNYVKVVTTTIPPSISVKNAAQQVGRSTVFITNKIGKGDLAYGYIFDVDGSKASSGEKVVIKDSAWDEFVRACEEYDKKNGKLNEIPLQMAAKELGISQGKLIAAISSGDLNHNEEANTVLKDSKFEAMLPV